MWAFFYNQTTNHKKITSWDLAQKNEKFYIFGQENYHKLTKNWPALSSVDTVDSKSVGVHHTLDDDSIQRHVKNPELLLETCSLTTYSLDNS